MSLKFLSSAALAALLAVPTIAGEMKIMIQDAYARSGAKSGAAFFVIINHAEIQDRLIGARAAFAKRVELHTHLEDANGVMRMREIEGGIPLPAGARHALKRGGDHVMFMGLEAPLEQGSTVPVTLVFEQAGEITVQMPVDNDRKPGHSGNDG